MILRWNIPAAVRRNGLWPLKRPVVRSDPAQKHGISPHDGKWGGGVSLVAF